ncbi:uncharacterized protein BO97DRAFT_465635 [Aspergillus homomorphus CBS 101889]|uniref:Transmembrane protein n=1 Tax=Aspergillus homomorphus (strain CBS 101889) TaxID=1450537 RepID=A0A395HI28_ASPHC|nr:hypothetical protein BO97DRAFT_465635 [Aspergillus homomorphus CBS 101889]RAL06825.1 hypothetical protein BO97DRAFT_465635 [Aspergillus homomorphus CBS 101889]
MSFYAPSDTRDHVPRHTPNANMECDDESQNARPKRKQRSLCQRVDTTGVLTIFLGPPFLLLAVTFLVLFWWESIKAIHGGDPEVYWFRIVNADWATRLVTICTTAIRTVMAFQAGLATAMVAGIVLETKGIPLLQGPLYSILRAVKVAPSSLFTATNFRPHLPPLISTLIIAEVLVTAASQFLSTIYLSDFANGIFTQNNNSTNVSLLDTEYSIASGWWTMRPAASWTFAELSEDFKEESNFHDTGHTFRALLPFGEETQRTKLRRYRGPAPVMDHRVTLRASACLINMAVQTIVVGMNSSSDNPEPTISWDRHTKSYDTGASRRQLGASRTRESFTRRGVLTLEPRSQWGDVLPLKDSNSGDDDLPAFFMAIDVSLPTVLMSNTNYTFSPGVLLANDGTGFYSGSAETTHVEIFQDTLNATASPALAVQAVFARLFQMAYYEQLVKMANMAAASTAFSVSSSIPSQWTGFIIGTALIATHLVIVTIITIQYMRNTNSSIIGNYWQTVSQVVSEETYPILEQADGMDDGEVKRWAKRNLHNLQSHRTLRSQHNGRTALDIGTNGKF